MVLIVQLADFTTSGQAVVKNVMRLCSYAVLQVHIGEGPAIPPDGPGFAFTG
jgi:hypothetical protein